MRTIKIFTAPWYPGNDPLLEVVEAAREKLEGKDVVLEVVDTSDDDNLSVAEDNVIITLPTAVLYKEAEEELEERRRISGALGLVEILGLAGIRSRARKTGQR